MTGVQTCALPILPAVDVRLPFPIFRQMPPEDILGIGRRFLRRMQQVHMHLFDFAPAFAMIAMRAGGYHIRPHMLPAHVPGVNMINCQPIITSAAILAGIIVAAKYLAPRQLDARSRTVDLHFQPNDRRTRDHLFYCFYVTASIDHHIGFARQEQSNRTPCTTDIDRFKISVKHQHGIVHSASTMGTIIC